MSSLHLKTNSLMSPLISFYCTGSLGSLEAPVWLNPVSSLLLNTYSLVSPLLFAYRSKRVQRDVRKVMEKFKKQI
jgi:hypothetical protein